MLLRPVELTTAFFQKSLSIDPNLAYPHVQLGRLLLHWEWDWSGAKNEFEHAIELDPNDLRARAQLAWVTEGMLGNNDRNIFYLRQIVASDPLDEEYLDYLAEVLEYAGQLDSAAATWQRLSDLHPGRYHAAYAEVMLLAGRPREALEELQKEVDEIQRRAGLALVYWKLGHKLESDAALIRLEEKQRDRRDPWLAYPYRIAEVHAYRGEADAAFEWLDRAYALRTPSMLVIVIDPLLRSLHGDPRFDAMLHKLKLDDWKRKVSAG